MLKQSAEMQAVLSERQDKMCALELAKKESFNAFQSQLDIAHKTETQLRIQLQKLKSAVKGTIILYNLYYFKIRNETTND